MRDVFPRYLPDLMYGRPVMVIGRVQGELHRQVLVDARLGGERTTLAVPVPRAWQQPCCIASVRARTHIVDLEYEAADRARSTIEPVDAVALELGISSSRTWFLALDASGRNEGNDGIQVPAAASAPDLVRREATVDQGEGR